MSVSKSTPCTDPVLLQRYLRDQLTETDESRIQEHVGRCTACQKALEGAAASPEMWASLRESSSHAIGAAERPEATDDRLSELEAYLGPTDDPHMLGRLGHYEVCGLIGRGSTGFVLKALEPRLNRYVAIKLMAPAYKASGLARKRFEREGRAVAAVAHEHVVPVYAVDEYRGLPFIVMRYVPGLSLQQRIDSHGALDNCEVTRIGLQVAQALAAAHAQGIVHRDVKPANVILESTVERAMVTDFGLARIADEASMTQSGTIAGTPQFMSPEQAKGDPIDSRSDLFSLGSLMYTACTGHPPFHAQTVFGVIHRVLDSQPQSIRAIHPEIRGWLVALIDKLMSKRPADRFQTAAEVADVLERELAHLQSPTTVEQPDRAWLTKPVAARARGRGGRFTAGWALFGVAGCALAAFGLFRGDESPRNDRSIASGGLGAFAVGGASGLELSVPGAEVTWTQDTTTAEAGAETASTTYAQALKQSFPLEAGKRLAVRVDRGAVVVVPGASNEVTVDVLRRVIAEDEAQAVSLLSNHAVHFAPEEEGLTVTSTFDDEFLQGADFASFDEVEVRLSVPAGVHSDVSTTLGSIAIGDVIGNVSVGSQGGGIRIARVDGDVVVRSRGGRVDFREGCSGNADILSILGSVQLAGVDGSARVRTSGGDVWLGESAGDIDVQTGGGDVEVSGVNGTTSVFTSNGDVLVRMTGTPSGFSSFNATDGDVALYVAEEAAVRIEARGQLASAFEVKVEETRFGSAVPWSVSELNGGGAQVQLTSSSGEVTIAALDPDWASSGGSAGHSLGGSGLSGSDLGGSGLSGSGLGGSGLGGSGSGGSISPLSASALEKVSGEPRAGGLVSVALPETVGNIDGYTLYLPVSHDTFEGTYPVIVYLQGAYGVGGEIGNINDWGLTRLIRDESDLSSERNQLLLDGFIVVSPHIVGGQYHDHPVVIEGILGDVFDAYKADPERVSVTGLSRGGHGSWGLGARLPDLFAAIVPVGANASAVHDYGRLANTAIWISHNTGDPIVSYFAALNAAAAVESRNGVEFLRIDGLDVSGTEFLDHRHVFTSGRLDTHDAWTELYSSVGFFQWLQRQRRAN